MTELTTINQAGAALGDTFDRRPIIHIEADGKYVFGGGVIEIADAVVDDRAASGHMDVGTMRMQWGIANGAGVTFPEPFLAGSTPSVTATPFSPGDNQSATLQNVDHLSFSAWVVRNESDVGIGAPTLHWSAIGVKP